LCGLCARRDRAKDAQKHLFLGSVTGHKLALEDQALAAARRKGFLGKRPRLAGNPEQRLGADAKVPWLTLRKGFSFLIPLCS